MEHRIKDYTYEVKCRKCGKITEMYLFPIGVNRNKDVIDWAFDHSTFPVQHHCECGDKNSIMLHDLISFKLNKDEKSI